MSTNPLHAADRAWSHEEAEPEKVEPKQVTEWPKSPNDIAYHGIAGEVVKTIEPKSEADPIALLVQFLTAFGNAVGRSPHFMAEADRHHANLFTVLVGESAKGRKGTSWGQARRPVELADQTWTPRIASGLSSGEGLIWQVRDPIVKREPIKQNGRVTDYESVVTDSGIDDKRLLAFESEFALVLRALEREGNRLSGIIRDAWDRGDLRTLTKNCPASASGAHVSIIGHVTRAELLRYLGDTEAANGFANRFLWICVKRSKFLPEGGVLAPDVLAAMGDKVRSALDFARSVGEVQRDEAARAAWREVYPTLSAGKAGLLGAVLGRAEAQVMRLALIYALLDRSTSIEADHLRAALALWDYAEASAQFIFGDRLGDPVGDAILDALRHNESGLTKTDIRDLLGRNYPAHRVDTALGSLLGAGKARQQTEGTGGRPAQRWFATK